MSLFDMEKGKISKSGETTNMLMMPRVDLFMFRPRVAMLFG